MKFFLLGIPYTLVRNHYGEQKAERSGVPLINHIDEGCRILSHLAARWPVMRAFCLHPLLQDDGALLRSLDLPSFYQGSHGMDPKTLIYAMEYRAVANAYLSKHCQGPDDSIKLSPIPGVNLMLIADKVQNRADFELYHKGSHPESDRLELYFENWLRALGVSEERYQELAAIGKDPSKDER